MASFSIPLTGLEVGFDGLEHDRERSLQHEHDGLQGADDELLRSLLPADRFDRRGRSDPGGRGREGGVERDRRLRRARSIRPATPRTWR